MSNILSVPLAGKLIVAPSGLEWALYAAKCGYLPFPLHPDTKAPYSREATAAALGIDPQGPSGFYLASADESTLRKLFSGDRANALIGLRMGNGRMAIDRDEKHGKSGAATMIANGWTVPETATQGTPSGGAHYIVALPPGVAAPTDRSGLGEGLDRRGDVGYIVLYDGAILMAPLAPAPDWSMANTQPLNGDRIAPGSGVLAPSYRIALEALNSRDPDMGRNEWLLFSGAFCAATSGLDGADAAPADWQAWNVSYGETNNPHDNARTWADFLRNGTTGDFRHLADLSEDANAKGWRHFGNQICMLPPTTIPRLEIAADGKGFFVRAADLEYRNPEFIIDGLVETDAMTLVFGDPGSGKSFIAYDMACCVALGVPFHGYDTKLGAVFIIAGEGHNGIKRRISAWEKHNGKSLSEAPLFVSRGAAQFLNNDSAAMVRGAVTSLAVTHGSPGLIVVDTLARNFGPGDENSQKDMGLFVAALDNLRGAYPGCSILVVHHSGHGEKERSRGSSVLKGALDCEYKVLKRDDRIVLENTKMKDAPKPDNMEFVLEPVDYSAALTAVRNSAPSSHTLSAADKLALDAFNLCGGDTVEIEEWRSRYYESRSGTGEAKQKAFKRAREALVLRGILIVGEDGCTYCRPPMPGMIPERPSG